MLSPYAPHITEELWEALGNQAGSLSTAPFPVFNADYLVENEFTYPVSINGKVRTKLTLSLDLEQSEIQEAVLANADVQRHIDGKPLKKVIIVKGRIINLVI